MTFGTWRWWGRQPHAPATFTPRNVPGTHFHYALSRPQGHGAVGRKYVTEKSSETTGIFFCKTLLFCTVLCIQWCIMSSELWLYQAWSFPSLHSWGLRYDFWLTLRYGSVTNGFLRVPPIQYCKVSSNVGPGCVLLEFPFGYFHEVRVVSEGEASIVVQAIEDEVRQ